MVNCCAFKCSSRSERNEPGISFHRFPKNYEIRKEWIENTMLKDWEPNEEDRLCSKHFEKNWFYATNMGKTRLLTKAVPTIFTELPNYLQIQLTEERERTLSSDRLTSEMLQIDCFGKQKLKRRLIHEIKKNREKSHKIRVLRQQVKRCKNKISTLTQLVRSLTSKKVLSDEDVIRLDDMPSIYTLSLVKTSEIEDAVHRKWFT